jgi:hypothetical protein
VDDIISHGPGREPGRLARHAPAALMLAILIVAAAMAIGHLPRHRAAGPRHPAPVAASGQVQLAGLGPGAARRLNSDHPCTCRTRPAITPAHAAIARRGTGLPARQPGRLPLTGPGRHATPGHLRSHPRMPRRRNARRAVRHRETPLQPTPNPASADHARRIARHGPEEAGGVSSPMLSEGSRASRRS